jgi:hypothetical protein
MLTVTRIETSTSHTVAIFSLLPVEEYGFHIRLFNHCPLHRETALKTSATAKQGGKTGMKTEIQMYEG